MKLPITHFHRHSSHNESQYFIKKKNQNERNSQQPQLQPRRCQELQVLGPGLRGPWVMMTMTTMMMVMVVVAIMMMMSSAPRRWSAEHLCRYYVLQDDHDGG